MIEDRTMSSDERMDDEVSTAHDHYVCVMQVIISLCLRQICAAIHAHIHKAFRRADTNKCNACVHVTLTLTCNVQKARICCLLFNERHLRISLFVIVDVCAMGVLPACKITQFQRRTVDNNKQET